MKTQNTTQNATFVNPEKVRVSKDRRFLLIILPGNQIIRKPVNYFKAILENITSEPQPVAETVGEGA